MIPKVIHYCWFGRNPQPDIIKKCITSWEKHLPDYEIVRWDEDNYNVEKIPFSAQAYAHKRYAFVSDYARFDILAKQGGIYMDTDVELIKPLDNFLECKAFTGFEKADLVAPGLILGAEPAHPAIEYMKDYYEKLPGFDMGHPETVVSIMTDYLKSKGLKTDNTLQTVDGTTIFPGEYFAPLDFQSNALKVTPNTVSIHHYAGSWLSPAEKAKVKAFQIFTRLLGEKNFASLRRKLK